LLIGTGAPVVSPLCGAPPAHPNPPAFRRGIRAGQPVCRGFPDRIAQNPEIAVTCGNVSM